MSEGQQVRSFARTWCRARPYSLIWNVWMPWTGRNLNYRYLVEKTIFRKTESANLQATGPGMSSSFSNAIFAGALSFNNACPGQEKHC